MDRTTGKFDSGTPGRLTSSQNLPTANVGKTSGRPLGGDPAGDLLCAHDEQLELLIDAFKDAAIWTSDGMGRIASWNSGARRLLGFTEVQIVGEPLSTLYTVEDVQLGIPEKELELAREFGSFTGEGRRIHATQDSFWASTRIVALRDPAGSLRGFAHIVRDITDNKRVDELRLMSELALNAMVLVNARGEILQINPQTEKLFGYSAEELIGRPIEIFVPEAFSKHHPAYRNAFFANPAVRAMGAGRDLFARRKDGVEFPVEIGLNPIHTAQGLVVLASIVDISERKRAEKRFRLAVESAPSAMIMVNEAGVIVLVNLQTERLFGYTRDQLLGQSIEILVPDRFKEAHPAMLRQFFAEPAARPIGAGRDLRGRRRDGTEFPAEIGLTPIETDEGALVLSAVVDITERLQSEERMRLHLAELAHVARLSTVGEMFSELAHEINQPLGAAANYARACVRLLRSGKDPTTGELQDWMEKTAAQAVRATEIIQRLKTFVKRGDAAHTRLDLNGVVEHVVSLPIYNTWSDGAVDRVTPTLHLEPDLPPVLVDRVQIEQVLVNLVRNGIDAMINVPPVERRLEIRTSQRDGRVCVAVQDSGSGITPEEMNELFKPFYTTKSSGMGLGLSISRSIIESHWGQLSVASEKGRGATFSFTLPVATGKIES
jgi:PAS domain S-box-containing protein